MPFCKECGASLNDDDTFCSNCSKEVIVLIKEEHTGLMTEQNDSIKAKEFVYGSPEEYGVPELKPPNLPKRNFWLWFPSFITWFGLVFYLSLNSNDLYSLSIRLRPNGVNSPDIPKAVNLVTLISCLVIPLAIFTHPLFTYQKFQRLYNYINSHPIKQENKPVTGAIASALNILFYSLTISGIILTTIFGLGIQLGIIGLVILITGLMIGIIFIIINSKWQKALNERIDILESKTFQEN